MRTLTSKFFVVMLLVIASSGCTTSVPHSTGTPVEYVTHDVLNGDWQGVSRYSWLSISRTRIGSYEVRISDGTASWENIYNNIRRNGTSTILISEGTPYYNDNGYRKVTVRETSDGYTMQWEWDLQKEASLPVTATRTVYRPKTPAEIAQKEAEQTPPPQDATPIKTVEPGMLDGTWSGPTTKLAISSSLVEWWSGPQGNLHGFSYLDFTKNGTVRYYVDGDWKNVGVFDTGDKYIMRWYTKNATKETVVSRLKTSKETAQQPSQ